VAVRGISFDIPERQMVAMLGPNGASKTTMMKILTGYLAPSEGSAAIAGYGVLAERMRAALDNISLDICRNEMLGVRAL
jgi:ABC-2 type transport system ATP-binding protein